MFADRLAPTLSQWGLFSIDLVANDAWSPNVDQAKYYL